MDIYAIQILSKEEVDPELAGDLRLVDSEDEDVADITVSAPLLKRYSKLGAFCGGLKEWCAKRSVHTSLLRTNGRLISWC